METHFVNLFTSSAYDWVEKKKSRDGWGEAGAESPPAQRMDERVSTKQLLQNKRKK